MALASGHLPKGAIGVSDFIVQICVEIGPKHDVYVLFIGILEK